MLRNKPQHSTRATKQLVKLLKSSVDQRVGNEIPRIKSALVGRDLKVSDITKRKGQIAPHPISSAIDDLPDSMKLKAKSNALKIKYDSPLSRLDFELLLPSPKIRKYATKDSKLIMDVIVGRDPRTLERTNAYYLFFASPAHAAAYILETMDSKLSGNPIKFEYANLDKELKFLYPPIIADIEISKYMDKNTIMNTFKSEMLKQLYRNETDSALVTIARQMWHDIKDRYADPKELPSKKSSKATKNPDSSDNHVNFLRKAAKIPYISRGSVVILSGVDKRKTVHDISNELWEYTLYPIEDIAIRRVTADPASETNTWIVIFASERDAKRCVMEYDDFAFTNSAQHLVVSNAEILD